MKKKSDESEKKFSWNNPLIWITILVLGYLVIRSNINDSKRNIYSIGTIIEYETVAVGEVSVRYVFTDKKGNKTVGIGNRGISLKNCLKTRWCIGKKFRVHYEKENPENCILLFEEPIGHCGFENCDDNK